MNFKEIILPVLTIILVVVAIALAAAGFSSWDFARECAENGGKMTNEGATLWCRY